MDSKAAAIAPMHLRRFIIASKPADSPAQPILSLGHWAMQRTWRRHAINEIPLVHH
jgi:hypothetical protein